MKKLLFMLFCFIATAAVTSAQSGSNLLEKNRNFTGAVAKQKQYHAIYQLDTNDPKIISKTFRNINNALNDPRLRGKLEIELIAYSGGTEVNLKSGKYGDDLKSLVEKGVIVAQCSNSLKEQKIDRSEIFNFIGVVPTGNGELIIREAQGWSIVKP